MTWRKRMNLPKEHGAWAMLYVPFFLGVLVAGRWSNAILFLLVCVSALFVSRESLLIWWRARKRGRQAGVAKRWLAIYSFIAILSGLPLLLAWRFFALVPLGLFGLGVLMLNGSQGAQLEERTVRNELLAIMALTMTAPAAYYVATGQWQANAWWLWFLCISYFASSIFFVKLAVASVHAKAVATRQQTRWQCLSYHAFLLVALAVLAISRSLSLFVLVAFAPILIRAFWQIAQPPQQLNLKRTGMLELLYAVLFLTFVTLGFRFE